MPALLVPILTLNLISEHIHSFPEERVIDFVGIIMAIIYSGSLGWACKLIVSKACSFNFKVYLKPSTNKDK
jgi:hypothetical protein